MVDWGLVASWAAMIWVLGGGDFSASETSRIIGPLLEWLFPEWSLDERMVWMGAIRKLAHPVEYGVFAVLVLRLRHALRPHAPLVAHSAVALAAALLLATLDESRQGTLGSRTGSPLDVALDTLGAAIALGLGVAAATLAGGQWLGIPGIRRSSDGDLPPTRPPAA